MASLDIFSEPYPPTGGIAAQGVRNTLGRPQHDLLTLLVREAVQNSWDARRTPPPIVRFRLDAWDATASQRTAIRDHVFHQRPVAGLDQLAQVLNSDEPLRLLAVGDGGTTGLGGPLRADETSPDESAPHDFVDFVRNVGQPPDKPHGGGTYGYGKSVFYLASEASTVVVFSRCRWRGTEESRLIGAALGASFKSGRGQKLKPHTGRHWWGRVKDGVIDPLGGRAADLLAEKIGLERAGLPGLGTSILILQPRFGQDIEPREVMTQLARAITWNFWPKMLPDSAGRLPMQFAVSWNGEKVSVPGPEDLPPLPAFVKAWRSIHSVRQGKAELSHWPVQEVRCQKPVQLLGHLALGQIAAEKRLMDSAAAFSGAAHHVALMREPELVVKYLEGPPFADGLREWAGVFLADIAVDRAFAASEPPAHDDWVPKTLERSRNKTLVNVALREINVATKALAEPKAPGGTATDQPPLGALASRLGGLILSVAGPGPSPPPGPPPGGGGAGSGRRPRPKVQILNSGLVVEDGTREAFVTVGVEPAREGTTLTATAAVVILDGSATEKVAPPGARAAILLGWDWNGTFVAGPDIVISGVGEQQATARVAVPTDAVVEIDVSAVHGARPGNP